MNFEIHRIPAFDDNYLWLIGDSSGNAVAVDPGDAAPIVEALDANNLKLAAIFTTHHHGDHIGGVDALVARFQCPVYGPRSRNIPQVTHPLKEGDRIEVLGASFAILEVPGHTLDHIVYYSNDIADNPVLFSGDTLFAAGCGRLFEGSPQQMYASLSKIANFPGNTAVYCAHEYTLANLSFAAAVEPENPDIADRLATVKEMRSQDIATVPTTLSLEKLTNPFLRSAEQGVLTAAGDRLGHVPASPVEAFASIRQWKDNF